MRIHDKVLNLLADAYRKNGAEMETLDMPTFGWFVDLLFAEGKLPADYYFICTSGGTSLPLRHPPLYNEFGYSNYGKPSIWELFGR